MANEWLDSILGKISKEAMESQGTDKQDHFERKVQAHDWIKGVTDLDPVAIEAEYQANLEAEAKMLGKTAAYDENETVKETLKKDYERDVKILSDYALAEMLATARGHKEQNTAEMFTEHKEKAMKEVSSSRAKAEKALLDLVGEHTALDWKEAFEKFSKEAKPEEPKEKDLFKSEVPEKAHDFNSPSDNKFKMPKDEEVAPGNGREADERKEVTEQPAVVQKEAAYGDSVFKGSVQECPSCETVFTDKAPIDTCPICRGKDVKRKENKKEAAVIDEAAVDKEAASNDAVIQAFISGQGGVNSMNLRMVKHPAGMMLVNYETPIAFKAAGGDLYLNSDKYSVTTSKIQNQIAKASGGQIKHVSAAELDAIMSEKNDPSQKVVKPDNVIEVPEPVKASVESPLKREEMPVEINSAAKCPVCDGDGKDLGNGEKDNMSCGACGITYACASLAPKADMQMDLDDMERKHNAPKDSLESNGVYSPEEIADTFINGNISDAREAIGNDISRFVEVLNILDGRPEAESFKRLMSKHAAKEIKNAATKSQVITKIAELSKKAEVPSAWIVTKDDSGQDVIARVEQPTNKKESEEDKTEELKK